MAAIHHFRIDLNLPCLSPKFCITVVSNIPWVLQSSRGKSKTMIIKIWAGVNKLHYGLRENGVSGKIRIIKNKIFRSVMRWGNYVHMWNMAKSNVLPFKCILGIFVIPKRQNLLLKVKPGQVHSKVGMYKTHVTGHRSPVQVRVQVTMLALFTIRNRVSA